MMLSIVSIVDNWLLVARVAREAVLVGAGGFTASGRTYSKDGYALIGEDSSAFEIGKARWNGKAWELLGVAPPIDAGYVSLMQRRASRLEAAGDQLGSLKLRLQLIGDVKP